MTALLFLCCAAISWWHGREMHDLGRRLGRLEATKEAKEAELERIQRNQEAATQAARRHLWVVK